MPEKANIAVYFGISCQDLFHRGRLGLIHVGLTSYSVSALIMLIFVPKYLKYFS